jgi:hypothetical protein
VGRPGVNSHVTRRATPVDRIIQIFGGQGPTDTRGKIETKSRGRYVNTHPSNAQEIQSQYHRERSLIQDLEFVEPKKVEKPHMKLNGLGNATRPAIRQ